MNASHWRRCGRSVMILGLILVGTAALADKDKRGRGEDDQRSGEAGLEGHEGQDPDAERDADPERRVERAHRDRRRDVIARSPGGERHAKLPHAAQEPSPRTQESTSGRQRGALTGSGPPSSLGWPTARPAETAAVYAPSPRKAFLKPDIALPSPSPSLGSLLGPNNNRTIARIRMISPAPSLMTRPT